MDMIERKDALLDFGTSADLVKDTAKDFGNILKVGKTSLGGFEIMIKPTTSLAGTGTVTANFALLTSANGSSDWSTILGTAEVSATDLAAGKVFKIALPHDIENKEYVKLQVTATGTTVTGGKFTACLDSYVGK